MYKKVFILTIILSMLILIGCDNNRVEPLYNDEDLVMHIGAWVAPNITKDGNGNYLYITEEQYQSIADSGINVIYALYEGADMNATMKALDMAQKAEIGYYVYDWSINGLFTDVFDASGNIINEDFQSDKEVLIQQIARYKDHPAFKGNLISDEPGANQFKRLGVFKEVYQQLLPDKDFYVNLFPTYSSLSQRDERSYEEYIDEYINLVKPKFLSYDHYPLMLFYDQPVLTDDYLLNLEIVSQKTQEANIPFWLFIQTIGFTVPSGTQTRRPSENDLRWQVAVSMAYGAKGIQHFTYWTPGSTSESFTSAMVSADGNKTDLYFAAQKVNNEVLNYDHIYLSFDWKGVITHSIDPDNENVNFRMLDTNLSSHKRIKEIKSTQDLLIGTFKDKNNYDGFMVVNYNDPALNLSNDVEIKFNNASKAIVIRKGIKEIVNLSRGKLSINLESGEGVFVIPF